MKLRNLALSASLLCALFCLPVNGGPDEPTMQEIIDRIRQPDEKTERATKLHLRLTAAEIPFESCSVDDLGANVVLGPGATPEQRERSEKIAQQVMSAPLSAEIPIVVDTLADALVVLRFEPANASAQQAVLKRYDELLTEAEGR